MTHLPDEAVSALEERLGRSFRDRSLLERALTHRSWASGPREAAVEDNRRLAFLGHAMLLMAVALYLYRTHPDWDESELDQARAAVVSRDTLGRVGRRLGLDRLLLVGPGEARSGARERTSLLVRAVEAIVGGVVVEAVDLKMAEYAAAPIVSTIVRSLLATVATVAPDVQDEAFLDRLGEELEQGPASAIPGEPSPGEDDWASRLEARIEHRFENRSLLQEALTHPSYGPGGQGGGASNARLAFAGDAIVGAVIGGFLYRARPDWSVMQMTKVKASAVSNAPLARIARALGLGDVVLLGPGAEGSGARSAPGVLAGALEALVAAVYLDREPDAERLAVRDFVLRLFGPSLQAVEGGPGLNPKAALQDRTQQARKALPTYRVAAESGPGHRKTFVVEACVEDQVMGVGAGSTKKAAEQNAAKDALDRLESTPWAGGG